MAWGGPGVEKQECLQGRPREGSFWLLLHRSFAGEVMPPSAPDLRHGGLAFIFLHFMPMCHWFRALPQDGNL